MHSFIDVLAGIGIGIAILSFWIEVYGYVDDFVISGQNGRSTPTPLRMIGPLTCGPN